MRRIFLLLLFSPLLFSCGSSSFTRKYQGCDSLVITFNFPSSDSVLKVVQTTDKKAIRQCLGWVDGPETEKFKCGYDGNLSFFVQGQLVLPVVFRYTDSGCRHFLFDVNNTLQSRRMSNEAADFLQSLSEGKEWY